MGQPQCSKESIKLGIRNTGLELEGHFCHFFQSPSDLTLSLQDCGISHCVNFKSQILIFPNSFAAIILSSTGRVNLMCQPIGDHGVPRDSVK